MTSSEDNIDTAAIQLCDAKREDLDDINHVIEACVMNWDLPQRVKHLSLSSYTYDAIDLKHLLLHIAKVDQQCVGVIAMDAEHIKSDSNLLIHGIFVHPKKQGQGIGTRLLSLAENTAQTLTATGLLVKAHKEAIGFFTHSGMEKLTIGDSNRDYPLRYWKSIK